MGPGVAGKCPFSSRMVQLMQARCSFRDENREVSKSQSIPSRQIHQQTKGGSEEKETAIEEVTLATGVRPQGCCVDHLEVWSWREPAVKSTKPAQKVTG